MKINTPITNLFRKNDAKALRKIHGALLHVDAPLAAEGAESAAYRFFGAMLIAALIFIASCMHSTIAHAYTEEQAIRTIIGEAANQGLTGMTAVGEVIRARGSLKGLYGYKASHVDKQPAWVWKTARKAWIASKTSQLTHGADHFENIKAFGCPYWVKNCIETFRYKDHIFYKEVA